MPETHLQLRGAIMRAHHWLWILAGVLVFAVAVAAAIAFGNGTTRRAAAIFAIFGCLLALVGFVVFCIVYLVAIGPNKCPYCGSWGGKQKTDETVIKTEKAVGLVTRRTLSQAWMGRSSAIGTTRWQERVPIVRTTYRLTFTCQHCHANWTATETDEEEDFSR